MKNYIKQDSEFPGGVSAFTFGKKDSATEIIETLLNGQYAKFSVERWLSEDEILEIETALGEEIITYGKIVFPSGFYRVYYMRNQK